MKLGRKDPEQPPPSPITPDMTSSAPAAATTSRNKRSSPLGFSKKCAWLRPIYTGALLLWIRGRHPPTIDVAILSVAKPHSQGSE